jgi:hypothetical protein
MGVPAKLPVAESPKAIADVAHLALIFGLDQHREGRHSSPPEQILMASFVTDVRFYIDLSPLQKLDG